MSMMRSVDTETHTCFLRPLFQFSHISPAIVLPLPTPAPSPMKKPALCTRYHEGSIEDSKAAYHTTSTRAVHIR